MLVTEASPRRGGGARRRAAGRRARREGAPARAPAAGLALAFDTYLAAYLIDPGRSDYAIADLVEEAALGLDVAAEEETARLVKAAAGALALQPGNTN